MKVRHDGEVLELRQRCEIEKTLILKEGDREVAQVRKTAVLSTFQRFQWIGKGEGRLRNLAFKEPAQRLTREGMSCDKNP